MSNAAARPHEKKALVVQVLPEESQSPQQEASAPAGASPRKTEATAVRKCRSSSVGSTEDGNQSVARECGDTNGRQKQSTITATTETAAAIGKGSTGTATAASTAVVERADLERLFASLYPGLPEEDGLRASRNERLSRGYGSVSLTYGEISAFGVRRRSDFLLVVVESNKVSNATDNPCHPQAIRRLKAILPDGDGGIGRGGGCSTLPSHPCPVEHRIP